MKNAAHYLLDHPEIRLIMLDLVMPFMNGPTLKKASDAKSEFLSGASHQLRTPMNHLLEFAHDQPAGQTYEETPDPNRSRSRCRRSVRRERLRSGSNPTAPWQNGSEHLFFLE
jgi:signal transduction histidine kinase